MSKSGLAFSHISLKDLHGQAAEYAKGIERLGFDPTPAWDYISEAVSIKDRERARELYAKACLFCLLLVLEEHKRTPLW